MTILNRGYIHLGGGEHEETSLQIIGSQAPSRRYAPSHRRCRPAALAQRAEVSAQSVYAIFRSKTGILTELLDQSTFGDKYEEAVRQAMSASDPETRLRLAARIARQIHEPLSATFDLLRGAGVVAPELAKLEQQRERLRYE